ncbi:MAG: hypothetical protein LCH59_05700 [Proteobacteria bacterium]|nr:hypothetical protein [Pseudomonadota bacterium]
MPELHRARSRASIARAAILLPILGLPLLLAACRAEPPPAERPPEPQAQAQAQQAHTQLRDAIKEPLDKARAVEQTLQQAADQQQKQADAAEGE